ncbi:MAG: 2-amino-4-hydroxy-6-hydroxymethyldihydropteridine diphosphokinase [Bifidobacteriaceae bacterium]|jgi:dihydroneopterin aldolase/2-amino-4-hydroxy-6-hydroxymethyldihydropteridine diphosphokinase|nr:2-amino-4-hydroxy-6-hydroxymethyldihydropteridine diphosphokinase [Bifidobacteriaceae bacterium]
MEWVLGAHGAPLDAIEVRGITARGFHGATAAERAVAQPFSADVSLHLDTRAAAAADDLGLTVDYAVTAKRVAAILEGEPLNLLETLAQRIADAVLESDAVEVADVVVHKPEAPMGVPFKDVSVRIRREHGGRHRAPGVADEPVPTFSPMFGLRPGDLAAAGGHGGDAWTPFGAKATGGRAAGGHAAAVLEEDAATPQRGEARVTGPHGLPPSGLRVTEPDGSPPADAGRASHAADGPASALGLIPDGQSVAGRRRRVIEPPEEVWGPVRTLDEVPRVPVDVVIGLGANQGDALSALRGALTDLRAEPGIEVVAVSPLARTAPVGMEDQPDFFNAVALLRTTLSARALLHTMQGIEEKYGRDHSGGRRWGPRPLDLDLIAFDTLLAGDDELTVPHPEAHTRAFVLVPWALMSPAGFLPGLGGGPVAQLANQAPDRAGIRWLAPGWDQPATPTPSSFYVAEAPSGDLTRISLGSGPLNGVGEVPPLPQPALSPRYGLTAPPAVSPRYGLAAQPPAPGSLEAQAAAEAAQLVAQAGFAPSSYAPPPPPPPAPVPAPGPAPAPAPGGPAAPATAFGAGATGVIGAGGLDVPGLPAGEGSPTQYIAPQPPLLDWAPPPSGYQAVAPVSPWAIRQWG